MGLDHSGNLIANWYEHTLKEFNLTHSQFVVLATLGWMKRKGSKVTQVEVATATKIDVATTSQIFRYLEKKGLVRRQHIKGDTRAKYPYLTKDGKQIIEKSLPKVRFEDKKFFEPLRNEKSNFITKLITLILG
jgi:MarR family transcriptional regulator, organic hydroperoxide resistance regulator